MPRLFPKGSLSGGAQAVGTYPGPSATQRAYEKSARKERKQKIPKAMERSTAGVERLVLAEWDAQEAQTQRANAPERKRKCTSTSSRSSSGFVTAHVSEHGCAIARARRAPAGPRTEPRTF